MQVEDGTGLPAANSYASREGADTYFSDRAISAWADETAAARDAALIRATDYIDSTYVFDGDKATDTQGLENPRYGDTALHPRLVKATIELAFLALSTDLFAAGSERSIAQETKSGDGLGSLSKTYVITSTDPFQRITQILEPIAHRRGGGIGVGSLA